MKPVIINKESNFVVITYWWGRGVPNKNTQRPCPEDMADDDDIDREPITYDKMINNWKKDCRENNCNYMSVEFPRFAKKGMYQLAINHKPDFIKEALKACYPRNVIYIDGDMRVLKYPCAFDVKDVDFMASGWNSDVRMCYKCECYDPYVLEISGGTIFFGQGYWANYLLDEWIEAVKQYPKKAEDRVISLLFNNKKLLLPVNIIQLPVEYLWLNMNYEDSIPHEAYSQIFISHPECLTGEERASDMGSDENRQPRSYNNDVTRNISCIRRKKTFNVYERLWFDENIFEGYDKDRLVIRQKLLKCSPFKGLTSWMKNIRKVINVHSFDEGFGSKRNAMIKKNLKQLTVLSSTIKSNSHNVGKVIHVENLYDKDVISKILYGLFNGHVVVVGERMMDVTLINDYMKKDVQFMLGNKNKYVDHFKKEFTVVLNEKKPIVFMNPNNILIYLVAMSKNINDLISVFNNSYDFISRVRCVWH